MSRIKTGPSLSTPGLKVLIIPAVCLLIGFLGYFSQWLFYTAPDLAPGPLTTRQATVFNTLLVCLWWTYYKAVTVDPGRYPFPSSTSTSSPPATVTRWCKKCCAPKPLRAHHCRHCGRCIPKMDHHCPWTANCVSMQTFPYFFRFLLYTNLSLWTLAYFLYRRLAGVWGDRHLPAYLGPSLAHLITLTIISLVCLGTMFALGILLFTTTKGWALNSTMIEDWEVERHEAMLTRHKDDTDFWGLDGGGGRLQLDAIEYPYDLGIFKNMSQAMGTSNPLLWILPLAGGPVISSTVGKGTGWEWEENGFNSRTGMWPPPDPEKLRRGNAGWPGAAATLAADSSVDQCGNYESPEEMKAAFTRRQEADFRRRQVQDQSHIMAELEEFDGPAGDDDAEIEDGEWEGGPVWTNSEGDRLWDYGVDEDVEEDLPNQSLGGEVSDDEDIPIAELIRRRRKKS
ncbi:DHHC palmitoyltransferase-domain-containing protein [Apodospora peruviana]|uniref:Palmitoyltransferase PFA4 n=1 Tax=Apodospora peruviana TaxID=516989 RepID=A0AAE0IQT4_9PEZI|nr:DHHC palmitoyltransferase-domain-containing protein [Apodospora peruviana]